MTKKKTKILSIVKKLQYKRKDLEEIVKSKKI